MGILSKTTWASPGAAVPEAHRGVAAPDSSLAVDQRGTDLVMDSADPSLLQRRGFRSNAGGNPTQAQGNIGSSSDTLAAIHGTVGSRDLRHTDEQERGNAAGEIGHESSPWSQSNGRTVLAIPAEAPPERPRLGWTGEDNTRSAWMIRPLFNRPFDKNMAEHPGAVEKVPQPAPRAFTARQTVDLAGDVHPSPGGSRGTKTGGLAQLAGTFRVVPGTWGADKLTTETATAPPPSARGRFRA